MSSNIERIRYTMMHRRAIRAIIEVYVLDSDKEEMMKRYFNHDMDKVVMNLLNVSFNDIKRIHRENNQHHCIVGKKYDRYDYMEMIIDWESSRYTKSDKPYNAKNTLIKYYSDIYGDVMPILREMGLDNDSDILDERVRRLIDYEIKDEDILHEIEEYINYRWKEII